MYLYDEVSKIESEEEDEVYAPKARFPEKYKVIHKTEVGEMVFNALGKNAPAMMYVESNKFVTRALGEGWAWWLIESKLKDALAWVAIKRANHAGLKTLLKKIFHETK